MVSYGFCITAYILYTAQINTSNYNGRSKFLIVYMTTSILAYVKYIE